MRSPFSLLDDDDPSMTQGIKPMERERNEYKPIRKVNNMPFAKFQITHQAKPSKQQPTKPNKQTHQKPQDKSVQQIKSENLLQGQTHQSKESESQQQYQSQTILQSKLPNPTLQQSDETSEDQQKKYILTKKHRQIKYQLNSDGDPPLLYDIGLDAEMIKDKLRLVLKMGEPDYDMIMNPDLAGPVLIAFAFGFLLLFSGQLHFGDIYALFIIGNGVMFFLFNFMARKGVVSMYSIMSILGYCLLPMLTLGVAGIFMKLNTGFGLILGLMISLWSSVAGGNFIEALLRGKNRKVLIIYPLFLFYANFAMIVIF